MKYKNKVYFRITGASNANGGMDIRMQKRLNKNGEKMKKDNLEDCQTHINRIPGDLTIGNENQDEFTIQNLGQCITDFESNEPVEGNLTANCDSKLKRTVMFINKRHVNIQNEKDNVLNSREKNDLLRRVAKIEEQLVKMQDQSNKSGRIK